MERTRGASLGGDTDPLLGEVLLGQPAHYEEVAEKPSAGTSTQATVQRNELSTFRGVFVPCVISMFGVILFLRVGWTVGQLGLVGAFAVLALCASVTFLTAISICCISTNGNMRGGGIYYMTSRSLGPEFGGSIGIIFFMANLLSASLYLKGLAEQLCTDYIDSAIINPTTNAYWNEVLVATVALVFCMGVCFVGASLFSRITIVIFAMVVFSVFMSAVSFIYSGLSLENFSDNFKLLFITDSFSPQCSDDGKVISDSGGGTPPSFFVVFAVFFNGMTGFNAGANMSGDLKNPGQSIPRGTMQACVAVASVYAFFFCLMAAGFRPSQAGAEEMGEGWGGWAAARELGVQHAIMQQVPFAGWAETLQRLAIVGSLFGSATSSIIGGSRILQALARDNVITVLAPFAIGSKRGDEPLVALVLGWIVVQGFLFVGSLDALAPTTTLCFLLSYTTVNFACFVLTISGAPNFRPAFRYFSWHTGAIGMVLSISTMCLVNITNAVISVCVAVIIFYYISVTCPPKRWGSIQQAIIFHQVRKYLLRLEDMPRQHIKYWRPGIMLLTAGVEVEDTQLLKLADELKKGGIYCLGTVVPVEEEGRMHLGTTNALKSVENWSSTVRLLNMKAFPMVNTAPSLRQGTQNLLLSAGLGGLRPHTLVLNFPESRASRPVYDVPGEPFGMKANEMVKIMNDALFMGMHTMVGRHVEKLLQVETLQRPPAQNPLQAVVDVLRTLSPAYSNSQYIDVWISRMDGLVLEATPASFSLALLSAWMLTTSRRWRGTKLRVMGIVSLWQDKEEHKLELEHTLLTLRIEAEVQVVTLDDGCLEREVKSTMEIGLSSPGHEPEVRAPAAMCQGQAEACDDDVLSPRFSEALSAVNSTIRENCANTALVFMPVAAPPTSNTSREDLRALVSDLEVYTASLDKISANLPPTLLVTGVHAVMTTQLHVLMYDVSGEFIVL
ncbi:hypothetical protein CYMTET_3954 [Cymbomonas tetramitiformis]|uniref:Amino acid permease/ SLC12A domain-containing protein n=1 Tax=Cymbomonas tetramitiformis TaxID=36881 RepID=A0AAE0LKZ9_9CHLO|nr:hypothetical protein CYMTET_3954 [Cymbomonas tetramitiformis]